MSPWSTVWLWSAVSERQSLSLKLVSTMSHIILTLVVPQPPFKKKSH